VNSSLAPHSCCRCRSSRIPTSTARSWPLCKHNGRRRLRPDRQPSAGHDGPHRRQSRTAGRNRRELEVWGRRPRGAAKQLDLVGGRCQGAAGRSGMQNRGRPEPLDVTRSSAASARTQSSAAHASDRRLSGWGPGQLEPSSRVGVAAERRQSRSDICDSAGTHGKRRFGGSAPIPPRCKCREACTERGQGSNLQPPTSILY